MVGAGRPTITPDALALDGLGMAELLSCDFEVTGIAEVARVLVFVATAKGEWFDVVDHGSQRGQPSLIAPFAKAICSSETSRALRLPSTATKALNHARARRRAHHWQSAPPR